MNLTITLLGLEGNEIGTVDVTVNVSEPEAATPFEGTAQVSDQVAGWKYEVAT